MYLRNIPSTSKELNQDEKRILAKLHFKSKECQNWLKSIESYVLEPEVKVLNLHRSDLTIPEIGAIFLFLVKSEVCELDVSSNEKLEGQMNPFCSRLSRTKIKKLNLSSCKLTLQDVMELMRSSVSLRITDLNISGNKFVLQEPECSEFITYVGESCLTSLNLRDSVEFTRFEDLSHFIDALCKTSITHLNLDRVFNEKGFNGRDERFRFYNAPLSLFHSLKHSAITHLSLADNDLRHSKFFKFDDSLRESKLVALNLSKNVCLDGYKLSEALVGTQITTLNLAESDGGFAYVVPSLKETKITDLDLSSPDDVFYGGEASRALKLLSETSLVTLRLGNWYLSNERGDILMSSLKCSKLKELDIRCNSFDNKGMLKFANFLSETDIISVNLSSDKTLEKKENAFGGGDPLGAANILEALKSTKVTSLKARYLKWNKETAKIAFPNLANSKFTHLDFGYNNLRGGLESLGAVLKLTAITDLNLKNNRLNDADVEVLAKSLKETCLTDLNLSHNEITDTGAVALAISLRDTNILSLKLKKNKIDKHGMCVIASNASEKLITVLKVCENPGNRRIVEAVIWKNRRQVVKLVRFFQQIAPEGGANAFRFGDNIGEMDVNKFVDECLNFYKVVDINHSSVTTVFLREGLAAMGHDRIKILLFEEFPRQFVQFIVTNIEAEIEGHVSLLEKAESKNLTRIVELLLLNRPIYTIDEAQDILHPYVYQLLKKYNLPICNVDVEPQGIEKIVKYFSENKKMNGVDEVLDMLKCLKP